MTVMTWTSAGVIQEGHFCIVAPRLRICNEFGSSAEQISAWEILDTNENIQKPKVNMPNIAKEYKVNYGKLRIWAYHDHITTIYPPTRRRETIRIASLRDGRRDPSWIQLGHFVVKTRTTHIDFWSKFRSFWWSFDPLNLGLGYLGISWNHTSGLMQLRKVFFWLYAFWLPFLAAGICPGMTSTLDDLRL